MSLSASWLVLAVLAARFLLKKAPKWINVLLWGLVAVRLLCPFSLESALSLIPSAEVVSPQIMTDPSPVINTGIPVVNEAVNPVITDTFAPELGDSAMAEYTFLTYSTCAARCVLPSRSTRMSI